MDKNSDEHVAATKQTYNKIFAEYASSNPILRDDVKQYLDRFITHLRGKAVLDVGCAGGYESEYLHSHDLQVTGCDISEEFVGVAQKRCPQCSFFVADMRRLDSRPDRYNGIWANASFLHVPKADALATLKGFYTILEQDGVLCVSVMQGNFDGLRENTDMHWPERHFSDYEPQELEGLLQQAGFEILDSDSSKKEWGPTFLIYFARKV